MENFLKDKKLFEKFECPTEYKPKDFIQKAKQFNYLVTQEMDNPNKLYIYGICPNVQKETKNGEENYTHPSFGMVSISRVSTTGKKLLGSSLKHENFISLKINKAEMVNRELHSTEFFSKNKIIEINLTSAQFAELITTLNYGSGTPCTITYDKYDGHIEYQEPSSSRPEDELNKMQTFAVQDKDKKINDIIQNAQSILNKNSIGKKDREYLLSLFKLLTNYTEEKFNFMQQQFQKKMEKHITDAKTEIDSTLTNIMLNKSNTQLSSNLKKE